MPESQDHRPQPQLLWNHLCSWADATVNPLLLWRLHLGILPVQSFFLVFLGLHVLLVAGPILFATQDGRPGAELFRFVFAGHLGLLVLFSCLMIPNLIMTIIK